VNYSVYYSILLSIL